MVLMQKSPAFLHQYLINLVILRRRNREGIELNSPPCADVRIYHYFIMLWMLRVGSVSAR